MKSKRLPDIVGIGVKKCGTTAVVNFLAAHPFIKTPRKIETFFFNYKYQNGLEFYKKMMPDVADHELVMEKTPGYFSSPPKDLPERIKKDLPNAKLILVLCEPVKRSFSDYAHERDRHERFNSKSVMNFGTFDSYLDEYLDRVNRTLVGKNEEILNRHMETFFKDIDANILEKGMYSVYLQRWTKLFDPTKLLILNGENFIQDPGPQVERMQEFLGIPKFLLATDFVRHPETGLFCIRPYWNWNETDFESERKSVPGWHDQLNCLTGKSKGRTRKAGGSLLATQEHISSLKSLYHRFNEELLEMTGIRF